VNFTVEIRSDTSAVAVMVSPSRNVDPSGGEVILTVGAAALMGMTTFEVAVCPRLSVAVAAAWMFSGGVSVGAFCSDPEVSGPEISGTVIWMV
jgi:hypothetical protein